MHINLLKVHFNEKSYNTFNFLVALKIWEMAKLNQFQFQFFDKKWETQIYKNYNFLQVLPWKNDCQLYFNKLTIEQPIVQTFA